MTAKHTKFLLAPLVALLAAAICCLTVSAAPFTAEPSDPAAAGTPSSSASTSSPADSTVPDGSSAAPDSSASGDTSVPPDASGSVPGSVPTAPSGEGDASVPPASMPTTTLPPVSQPTETDTGSKASLALSAAALVLSMAAVGVSAVLSIFGIKKMSRRSRAERDELEQLTAMVRQMEQQMAQLTSQPLAETLRYPSASSQPRAAQPTAPAAPAAAAQTVSHPASSVSARGLYIVGRQNIANNNSALLYYADASGGDKSIEVYTDNTARLNEQLYAGLRKNTASLLSSGFLDLFDVYVAGQQLTPQNLSRFPAFLFFDRMVSPARLDPRSVNAGGRVTVLQKGEVHFRA